MADETKQATTPAPIAIVEWMDGDAGLVCDGPACAFGADVATTAEIGLTPAETPVGEAQKPATGIA